MTRPVVFIGMETSGALRSRFAARGCFAVSADVLPAEDGSVFSERDGGHIQGDVFEALDFLWARSLWPAVAVFHPTCTMHTVSAAWAFNEPDFARYPGVGYHQRVKAGTLTGAARRAARDAAEADLEKIRRLPIRLKVVENPIGTISTRTSYGKPCDVLQPYEFGEDASKATCLWAFEKDGTKAPFPIHRNPVLRVAPTLRSNGKRHWSNQTDTGQNRLSPGADRWKDRSRTYPGIADAIVSRCMAEIIMSEMTTDNEGIFA